jgi:hypothetical protein
MREHEMTADVSKSREITIQLPDEFSPGRVTIKILQDPEEENVAAGDKTPDELFALLDRLRANRVSFRSIEEINRYVDEERSSWD